MLVTTITKKETIRVIKRIRTALLETYSSENSRLLSYFKQRPLPVDELPSVGLFDHLLELVKLTRQEYDGMGFDEQVEVCYRIEQVVSEDDKQRIGEDLVQQGNDSPSWAFLDLVTPTLLNPNTPLVHWSNSAWEVFVKGFQHGCWDVERLGLTTYYGNRGKSGPGYNFAFLADSGEAENRKRKYGKQAVLFRSSGVETEHCGDEEIQVIFWGPSITSMVGYLECDENDSDRVVLTMENRAGNHSFPSVEAATEFAFRHG